MRSRNWVRRESARRRRLRTEEKAPYRRAIRLALHVFRSPVVSFDESFEGASLGAKDDRLANSGEVVARGLTLTRLREMLTQRSTSVKTPRLVNRTSTFNQTISLLRRSETESTYRNLAWGIRGSIGDGEDEGSDDVSERKRSHEQSVRDT